MEWDSTQRKHWRKKGLARSEQFGFLEKERVVHWAANTSALGGGRGKGSESGAGIGRSNVRKKKMGKIVKLFFYKY